MEIFDEYSRYKDYVNENLADFLPEVDGNSNTLTEAMCYSLRTGGKRLRPVLLLAACEFSGGDMSQALPYACAVEYIHTYSLIHDDLPAMDDDDLRRGAPTNHMVYGEAIAILAGDALLTSAFEVMNRDMLLYFDDPEKLKRRVRAACEIAKCSGCRGMIAGQTADMEAEGRSVAPEILDYIHLNKTAALIVASVKAGAYIGGADADTLANLEKYAENLGLAFQIEDDLLDVTGKEGETGKRVGADAGRAKSTYPSVHGLPGSMRHLRKLTDEALKSIEPYYDNAEFFVLLAKTLARRSA